MAELVELFEKSCIIQDWYKIPEISKSDFVKCCEPIFQVLEEKHKSKSCIDPFLRAVLDSYIDWETSEKIRLKQKVLEMKMGDFHEELLGKFSGWKTLPLGHKTGMDVSNEEETIYLECKNKHNTCNSDQLKQIYKKLEEIKKSGKRSILVQINCPEGKVKKSTKNPDSEVFNGKQIYNLVSGREDFFDDLLDTIKYVFQNFKTLLSLKESFNLITDSKS